MNCNNTTYIVALHSAFCLLSVGRDFFDRGWIQQSPPSFCAQGKSVCVCVCVWSFTPAACASIVWFITELWETLELCVSIGNISASHLRGPGVKSPLIFWQYWLEGCSRFTESLLAHTRIWCQVGYYHFLPHPFHFFIRGLFLSLTPRCVLIAPLLTNHE